MNFFFSKLFKFVFELQFQKFPPQLEESPTPSISFPYHVKTHPMHTSFSWYGNNFSIVSLYIPAHCFSPMLEKPGKILQLFRHILRSLNELLQFPWLPFSYIFIGEIKNYQLVFMVKHRDGKNTSSELKFRARWSKFSCLRLKSWKIAISMEKSWKFFRKKKSSISVASLTIDWCV